MAARLNGQRTCCIQHVSIETTCSTILCFNESIYNICLRNDVICIMYGNSACLMPNGIVNETNMSTAFKRVVPLTRISRTRMYASTTNNTALIAGVSSVYIIRSTIHRNMCPTNSSPRYYEDFFSKASTNTYNLIYGTAQSIQEMVLPTFFCN